MKDNVILYLYDSFDNLELSDILDRYLDIEAELSDCLVNCKHNSSDMLLRTNINHCIYIINYFKRDYPDFLDTLQYYIEHFNSKSDIEKLDYLESISIEVSYLIKKINSLIFKLSDYLKF